MHELNREEIKHIGELLLSPHKDNQALAIGFIEANPPVIERLGKELDVYLAYNPKAEALCSLVQEHSDYRQEKNPVSVLYLAMFNRDGLEGMHSLIEQFIEESAQYELYIAMDIDRMLGFGHLAYYLSEISPNYKVAIAYYRKCLEYCPDQAWMLFNLAHNLCYKLPEGMYLEDHLEEVEDLFLKAYALHPYKSALYNLAYINRYVGRAEKAEYYYKRCMNEFPLSEDGWNGYAYFLITQERYEEAMEITQQAEALEQSQGSKTIHHTYDNYGLIYWKGRGLIDTAEKYFKKAIKANKWHEETMENAIEMLFGWGEYEKAVKWQLKLLKLRPNDVDLIRDIAELYEELEDREMVLRYYRKLIKLQPDDTKAKHAFKIWKDRR